jgi:hypothetical protein
VDVAHRPRKDAQAVVAQPPASAVAQQPPALAAVVAQAPVHPVVVAAVVLAPVAEARPDVAVPVARSVVARAGVVVAKKNFSRWTRRPIRPLTPQSQRAKSSSNVLRRRSI